MINKGSASIRNYCSPKILFFTLGLFFCLNSFCQESQKRIYISISTGTGINKLNTDSGKSKAMGSFALGLNVNYNISNSLSISTGLFHQKNNGKVEYNNHSFIYGAAHYSFKNLMIPLECKIAISKRISLIMGLQSVYNYKVSTLFTSPIQHQNFNSLTENDFDDWSYDAVLGLSLGNQKRNLNLKFYSSINDINGSLYSSNFLKNLKNRGVQISYTRTIGRK